MMAVNQGSSHATLLIDSHVHLYPQYDWAQAITALIHNLPATLQTLTPQQNIIPVGLLAESKSNRFYREIIETGTPLRKGALQVEAGPDAGSLIIRENGNVKGYLIAGRQMVTSENLEVLALGKDTTLSDGLPLAEAIPTITAQGAIPVISWSPGKWFFRRGKLVHALIESMPAGSFLMGDIGLRPRLWPLPQLMKLATQRGFKIIDGSDSLPLSGDECWIGRTGSQVSGSFDSQNPAASIRTILQTPTSKFTPIGQHSSLLMFAHRWGRNRFKP